jgi:UPF0755 protein
MYIKKILVAILLLGLVGLAIFSYYVYNSVFSPNTAFNNEEAHVYISTDASFEDVLNEIAPLLKDTSSFAKVAHKKEYSSNVKAGHYIITKGMSNNDIINTIRSRNIPISIKFNNQERLENLAGHLANQIEPDSITILNAMRDPEFLKISGFSDATALGMYIPNTYEVYWNTSAEAFRDKLLNEYNRFWTSARNQKAKEIGLTRDQVISLAAIVQKETAKVDERPRVAGVYMNRLQIGMPLQADPTVIYAKKLSENNFEQVIKRVLYKDLEINSPYNTYKNTGVPPGPIAMPDITAMDGVLNYEKHDYFYFVADVTNFGYHKFAKTLTQHNRNKTEYVRWVNENGINR